MVDLIALRLELEVARRARIDAELAGATHAHQLQPMRAGCPLRQIELEEPFAPMSAWAGASQPLLVAA